MQFSLLLLICHLTTYVLLQLLFQVDETNDCAKRSGHAGVTINKIPSAHACSYEACYESSLNQPMAGQPLRNSSRWLGKLFRAL